MKDTTALLPYILFGDFGLLTIMPRYLFCVLLPVMIFLGFFRGILERLPCLRYSRQDFFYGLAGLGCTTAALASLSSMEDRRHRRFMVWMLVLLIPCSSQLTMIAAFASIVSFRVFAVYLLFTLGSMALLLTLLHRLYPSPACPASATSRMPGPLRPISICREAFLSVVTTIPSFSAGSGIISLLTYLGVMENLNALFAPFLYRLLHLPREAVDLFVVNLFKRDFGSAALLSFARAGAFDGVQMVIVMVMLTFCVPCFNSTMLLLKQEKLPTTIFLWLGSFCISLLLGWLISKILLQCTF